MEKNRLLVVTTSYPVTKGSISGIFVKRLNDALSGYFEIRVVCPAGVESKAKGYVSQARYAPWRLQTLAHRAGGIPVALRENKLIVLLVPIMLFSMFFTTFLNLRKSNKIIAHWAINGVIAGACNLFYKRPLITVFHGTDANAVNSSVVSRLLALMAIVLSDRVVGVSESITKSLKECFPRYNDKIHFLSNGVEEKLFDLKPTNSGIFTFLTIANLNHLKGVADVIQAFSQLTNKDTSLVVVGEGPEKKELERLAIKLQVKDRVAFVGVLPPEGVPQFLNDANAFVLASYSEGRPSVILEAMASGKAVLATSLPGILEIIEPGYNGFLFNPGDTHRLTILMEDLINQPSLAESIGYNAKQYILDKKLTWANTAEQYLSLFRSIE